MANLSAVQQSRGSRQSSAPAAAQKKAGATGRTQHQPHSSFEWLPFLASGAQRFASLHLSSLEEKQHGSSLCLLTAHPCRKKPPV